MKKAIITFALLLAIMLMFIGWNSCAPINGKNGVRGKTGQIGLTGEDGTSVQPVITTLYDGVITNKNFNTVPLALDGAIFGGIRFTNTNDDSIVVYFSFDENPNICNSSIIYLKPHESFGWYEVINYNSLYWKSCSVNKTVKIELIKF